MDVAKRFLEYAGAFEQTFADDDWHRLKPFFTDDAIYTVTGEAPLGGRWEGSEQILAALQESVNQLDRKFDTRQVEPLGSPTIADETFEMQWRATYSKSGCPDLVIGGTERASFEGNRIRLLEDLMEDGSDQRIQEFFERYFS